MKKFMVIIVLLFLFMRVSTSDFFNFRAFEESKKFAEELKINSIVYRLMATLGEVESGHNYYAVGGSNETGKFQIQKNTWKRYSMKYFKRIVPNTPEYQELLTYNVLYDYVLNGYAIDQIGAIWNAGEGSLKNDAWKTKIGVNKFGISYNTPAYVNKFVNTYQKVSTELSSTYLCSISRNLYLLT